MYLGDMSVFLLSHLSKLWNKAKLSKCFTDQKGHLKHYFSGKILKYQIYKIPKPRGFGERRIQFDENAIKDIIKIWPFRAQSIYSEVSLPTINVTYSQVHLYRIPASKFH